MKILLLGSRGMLGSDCRTVLNHGNEIIAPTKEEMDIISWDGVIDGLHRLSPDVILNCAAFTDVDACEYEHYTVRKINVEGPRNLAQGSARFHSKLIHLSTDYVFDGQKPIPQPYFEDDSPNPLSAYGKSKLESEVAVRENSPNYMIIRTGWLYGLNGNNFVGAVVRQAVRNHGGTLRVVDDQFGSPTWTYRLALQIRELLGSGLRGTFHATSEGFCSRLECAQYILKKLNLEAEAVPCKLKDFPKAAPRPSNCLLENRYLKKHGVNVMVDWKEDLDQFLEEQGEALIEKASQPD